jgi:hypothetical protein
LWQRRDNLLTKRKISAAPRWQKLRQPSYRRVRKQNIPPTVSVHYKTTPMKRTTLVFILILFSAEITFVFSQTTINQTDKNGLKQGVWVKYSASNIIDSMFYLNDTLNGQFKSYFKNSTSFRQYGEYAKGIRIGIWKFFDLGNLRAEEVTRGANKDSVRNNKGELVLPTFYSYVKLYDSKTSKLKSEGRVLYYDSWDSDLSNEHGLWIYYNYNGDTISLRTFEYGKIITNNVR